MTTIESKDSPEDNSVEDLAMNPRDAESIRVSKFTITGASKKWHDEAEDVKLPGQKVAKTELY